MSKHATTATMTRRELLGGGGALAASLVLAACGGSSDDVTEETQAEEATQSEEAPASDATEAEDGASDTAGLGHDGALVIGTDCIFPPYVWRADTESEYTVAIRDEDAFADGYDMQICKIIAEELGLTPIVWAMTADAIPQIMHQGAIDIAAGGLSADFLARDAWAEYARTSDACFVEHYSYDAYGAPHHDDSGEETPLFLAVSAEKEDVLPQINEILAGISDEERQQMWEAATARSETAV